VKSCVLAGTKRGTFYGLEGKMGHLGIQTPEIR
jgi:hypothetical protein